jgi:tetratricopeptide (TPR) repeat protein
MLASRAAIGDPPRCSGRPKMPKEAPGRNDPCPCGSGKKYKKCCIAKEVIVRDTAPHQTAWEQLTSGDQAKFAEEALELDDLSNGALDEIKAGRFDEAERLCEELLRQYPDVIDGHDRLGMLCQAQGRHQEAADHYGKVLEIIQQHPGDYDSELMDMFRRQREEAIAKAKPSG